MGKGKKAKNKTDDNWEDDLAEIAKESGIDFNKENDTEEFIANIPKKKEKKKGKHKTEDLDEIEEPTEPVKSASKRNEKVKASFSVLMIDDDDDDDVDFKEDASIEDDVQPEADIKKGKKKGEMKQANPVIEIEDSLTKKSKEANNEIETKPIIDAQIEKNPTEKKETKIKEHDGGNQVNLSDDEGPKIKTAAQKKAEKKEREKEKKKAEKAKKKGKAPDASDKKALTEEGDNVLIDKVDDKSPRDGKEVNEDTEPTAGGENAERSEEEDDGEEGEKKKKKKKKKKKGKEEDEKKKGKKPGKLAIKQMQEALEKVKQEEERLRKEEEAKELALQEAERQREEKMRLEKERKEKRKQKEKEKKERMKKEGKLLTPAQREQKRRAEQMLEAMKKQGLTVPSKENAEQRKKVQYGSKKKNNKRLQTQTSEEAAKDNAIDEEHSKNVAETEEVKVEESAVETEKAEADDQQPKLPPADEDDVKDDWALSSDEENEKDVKEKPKVEENTKETVDVKAEEDEEESEESDSEESEEESSEEESSDESSESGEEYEKMTPEKIKERARERIMKRRVVAEANRSVDHLRCPVICVLGHVDTGKTKILDKIRHTNVQDGEAGGITQQIGATMVPLDTVRTQTKMIKEFQKFDLKLPGLLIIDTPGHESFSNLRTRGSSLCDMAILVVDIMHGLEPQTVESINLLRKKHTPFIVALNKIDRLFEWKRGPASQIEDTIKKQKKNTKLEFEERVQLVVREFAEQGLNAALFFKNTDEKNFISMVPTSAHSGDGMGDLMSTICKLTQTRMAKKLAYSQEIQSTVMEVKALPGLGTTVDTILVNGKLREGDTIVTGGLDGPVVTQIRAILTPQPLRELRVKSNYIQHKELVGAQGCKITGKDLEKVMAGAPVFVAENHDEIEVLKDEVAEIVKSCLQAIKLSERGVYVQASTLGSLEALLEFLKTSKIPRIKGCVYMEEIAPAVRGYFMYSGVNIGPVHKKDVMRTSVMLEHEPLYSVILAFDVKVEREAQELADKEGIKIFTADIIYHLFDKFTAYTEEYKQKEKDKHKHIAVFPCKLRVLPEHIFNSRDPIVIGFHIEAGIIRLGTPLTVPTKEFCDIGVVTGIEANHKNMERATAGQEVCVKIEPTGEAPRMYGRHFTHEDMVVSKISRESIDALKKYFRDEMSKADWQVIIEMKKTFGIL